MKRIPTKKEWAFIKAWTKEFIDTLPDSAFLVVEKAFVEGKSVDKRCRHFPVRDETGNLLDKAVLSQIPQYIASHLSPVVDDTEELRVRATQAYEALLSQPNPPTEGGKPIHSEGGIQAMDLEKKIQELEKALEAAKAANQKLETEIAQLKAEDGKRALAEVQEKLRTLEAEVETLTASKQAVATELQAVKAEKDALATEKEQAEAKAESLSAEIKKRDDEAAAAMVAARKAEVETLKASIDEEDYNKLIEKAEAQTSVDDWDFAIKGFKKFVGAKTQTTAPDTTVPDPHIQASLETAGGVVTPPAKTGGPLAGLREFHKNLKK